MSDGLGAAGIPGGSSIIQRPLPPQVQAMADRAAGVSEAVTGTEVMKEYPIATHAHTIEFRIGSREELLELYQELKRHWLKEPAFFEGGQIVSEDESTGKEMKPRSLGGTMYRTCGLSCSLSCPNVRCTGVSSKLTSQSNHCAACCCNCDAMAEF